MGGRRERTIFWSIAALLVAGAALAYRLLLGPSPGPPRVPAPSGGAPAAVRLTVAQTFGDVTIVRAGARSRAAPGDELRADDALETAPGARVVLDGAGYQVQLDEDGSFDVREITAELSRFRLAQGLVSARVQDPGHAVEIEGDPGSVVRTRGGDLAVARSGGTVAVGVERGSAEFTASGGTVVLTAGQQSVAASGGRPSAPAPIPSSLLLKVTWPEERTTNHRRIVITGRTQPGAIVVLGEERVEVQPDGRFTHVIALREGRQRLSARARAVGGSASSEGPVILLDTRAPDPRFDTTDLWRRPRK